MTQAAPRFAPAPLSWPRRLIDQWLEERARGLLRDADRALASLAEVRLRSGARVPPPDTDYKRARFVLMRRLQAAAAIFEAPVTDEEWAGR